jgi:hypothetical protein
MARIPRAGSGKVLMILAGLWQSSVPATAVAQVRGTWPPGLPPAAAVNRRLDSLERVVLTSDNPDQRSGAAVDLLSPGTWWHGNADSVPPSENRYPGVVARLARVYRQSNDLLVRQTILLSMPYQAERTEAIAVVEEAAHEANPVSAPRPGSITVDDTPRSPAIAVSVLTAMGPEGEVALRRLYAQGSVQDLRARRLLEELARQGFRRPREK